MNSSRAENAYLDEENRQQAKIENPELIIPVIQEQARIDKEIVETGKVRILKKVGEHEKLIDVPLMREEVAIERVPVNQFVETAPEPRLDGDTFVIPVVREEVVIQKRLLLVEELHVRKQILESHEPQSVTLKKEEVEITRTAANEKGG